MGIDERHRAAETYVRARRTGETTAARRLSELLSDSVVLITGAGELSGRAAVLEHVSGQWPQTPALGLGGFGEAHEDGEDAVVIEGEINHLGAAPSAASFRFCFDASDAITRVEERFVQRPPGEALQEMPLLLRGLINAALSIGRPIVFAYVDEHGHPNQSLRGSVQVYGPTQLSLWARPGSRLAGALARNGHVSLLYRDSTTRTTLVITGRAAVMTEEGARRRVFELSPEVEQRHDPAMAGSAVIVEVDEIRATTTEGPITVRPR